MRTIDADALLNRSPEDVHLDEEGFEIWYKEEILKAPTVEPAQKVIVVQPEIIDPVAKAIVDTIYKLDWNTIIKMYRGGACKGEWIRDELHNTVCSICGGIRRDNRIEHVDFCNKCGADMKPARI